MVQGNKVMPSYNFSYQNGTLKFFDENGLEIEVSGKILVNGFEASVDVNPVVIKNGCGGSIATLSAVIAVPSLMGITLLFYRKKKGGK